ncbi:hypothetical protein ASPCAL13516 [Aspergillus calidoustus]|uniref:Uncharacterized protein n=1 Tax=Aspergillus calidoustus TaxID=454130 RepID=A0A0U5CHS2_ASPCI|nr:hypothetical protein ASPCAL13516 [Aspergillus calidoustus]
MSQSTEDLVRRLQQEPELFLRAFATPDENNNAFTIKGLLKAVYQLGYTEEDFMKASWIAVGFLPAFLDKDSGTPSSTAGLTNDAPEPIGSPQLSIKAPVGLYRISRLGDKTGDVEPLGFFEIRPHKSGWNHRTFIVDDQVAEAKIHWADNYLESDPKQVWRLSTATSLENGPRYNLGFWVDFADAAQPFKFAGTITAGDGGSEKLDIEGVRDDDLYSSFGGFFGRMVNQFISSHKPSTPPPEQNVVFGTPPNGPPGSSPATGFDIASGLGFTFMEWAAQWYAMRIIRQNHEAARPPHDVVLVRSDEDVAFDDMTEERILKLEEEWLKEKKFKALEPCKMADSDRRDDRKDPDQDPSGGSGRSPWPSGGGRTGGIIAIETKTIRVTARHTSNEVKKACDAILDVVGRPLRDKATELIMDSLTRLNEEHQVVEPAKNPIIDWPTVIQSAITKTCPKEGDPARTIVEFQDAYLLALRQSIAPVLMSYLAPVYASLASQPGTSHVLDYFTRGVDFANYSINDALLKTMSTEKVYAGIISETIRATLVKQRGLGPSTSTTPGGGPRDQESFDLQLQGLQTASEVQQYYAKSIDTIAKLLESGTLNLQNADTVLREKLNMVAVQPGVYAPAALPNEWFQTADALGNMGMMVGLAAGYRGGKGGKKGSGGYGESGLSTADSSVLVSCSSGIGVSI